MPTQNAPLKSPLAAADAIDLAPFTTAQRRLGAFSELTTVLMLSALGLASVGLLVAGAWRPERSSLWVAAAALWSAAGGWAAAAIMVFARARVFRGVTARPSSFGAGLIQTATAGGMALLALAASVLAWRSAMTSQPTAVRPDQIVAGAALFAAFATLLAERWTASLPAAELPEAPGLAGLLRLPLLVFLLIGAGRALQAAGYRWGAVADRLAAAVAGLVALELLLRAAATLFLPTPPIETAVALARSTLANAIFRRPPRPGALGRAVQAQFGIDLARSWALFYLRRAALPVLLLLLVAGWGLSGVTALPLNRRAIYERLGRPVAVLGPGLHAHLPWPLGRLHLVELGVIHDTTVVAAAVPPPLVEVDDDEGGPMAPPPPPPNGPSGAEDQPGAQYDRLWDQTHPAEASYLVASESRGQQGFQILDVDLRVMWRIGPAPADAVRAAYATTDPEALIRAEAGRTLARAFAGHTLAALLGTDRGGFAAAFQQALQADLDRLGTGLQVAELVVEAIHPPAGAAGAYHAVQAAAIDAQTARASAYGDAATRAGAAAQEADEARNVARAGAAGTVAEARAQALLFAADRASDGAAPAAFVLERRLERLAGGLAQRRVVVVDHRLADTTIDLRPSGAADVTAK